jgi:glycosyltransferase involved in cell wall biosynthesis
VITAFGFGGAEKLLVDLVNIQSKNHEVHIVFLKGEPLLKPLLTGAVELHKVDLGIRCPSMLRELIKKMNPNVVHTHLGHADLIGLLACRGLAVKRFCTMHNIWFKWNWKDHIIFFIYKILFRTVAKTCKVIAISKSVYRHVKKVLAVPEHNIKLMYNAVPHIVVAENKYKLRNELGIHENSFCILFVGRLEIQKSVETLLYAAKALKKDIPELRIMIVGTGTLQETLVNLAAALDISDITCFAGTKSQVEKYFAASDVFVLPSLFEGFGIVIIEAFRASLPVVATKIEGPEELIENEITGLLFEPKDFNALTLQILKLYKSVDLRQQIGASGFSSYANNYNISDYAKQIEALYLE